MIHTNIFQRRGTMLLMLTGVMSCALMFVSCTTDYDLAVKDYDTAVTLYSKSADFASYKYFIMPDSIIHVLPTGVNDDLSRKYDALVLQNVAGNFASRGYVRITDTTLYQPDFAVALVAYSSTYVGYYYDWWYYWGWYPYYPGGPGYGYYPPGGVTYSYTTGTLVVSMIDVKQTDVANKKIVPVWFGNIAGLLGDVGASTQSRIVTGLNSLFSQSPYLVSGQ